MNRVMVSSTVRDLPVYRQQVLDACMKQEMFPEMMEFLPAADGDAIKESLELVDKSDIYLGIFAYRYGYVPAGYEISITEMEYNRAIERKIPCLIFVMSEDHPFNPKDIERGKGEERLLAFKQRLQANHVVNFFTWPLDLQVRIVNSLSRYRNAGIRKPLRVFESSDIPEPPEPYIAHPYLLLQTPSLIGRRTELSLLTDWVTKPNVGHYKARILNIVGIGGMGKSALTWKWFNDVAPKKMKPLAGRMWWSFQERDSFFENFIMCALAYVTGLGREAWEGQPLSQLEKKLLAILDREPFLLALDGLERVLIAYNQTGKEKLSGQAENAIGGAAELTPEGADYDDHRLRKTADPRLGLFLRKLAAVRASRVLVSSRLYPADLETHPLYPIPGSEAPSLRGLSDDDAVALWREFGVRGSRRALLRLFNKFGNYPLLIQLLAGVVARYRPHPGNFDRWLRDHPHFTPFGVKLQHADSEVFELALRGLPKGPQKALGLIAGLRIPCTYETLTALLVGADKPFSHERWLSKALTELEDRGLLGWEEWALRYDLHPVVRGVVWARLPETSKKDIYKAMHDYLRAIPMIKDVKNFEDLLPAIELYHTLIGLRRYKEAADLFYEQLNEVTLYRFSAPRERTELLESLFPYGTGRLPALRNPVDQAFILNALAATYLTGGKPGQAVALYRRHNGIQQKLDDKENLCVGTGVLSNALRQSGGLRESEAEARQALLLSRELKDEFLEAVSLGWLGITLAVRGSVNDGEKCLREARRIFKKRKEDPPEELAGRHDASAEATADAFLARIMLWKGFPGAAQLLVDDAYQLANVEHFQRYVVLARRMLGAVALANDERAQADQFLNRALIDARAMDLVVEEVLALIELAELNLKRGAIAAARDLLEDVWQLVERGPYPLFEADANNLLAQIEQHEGNTEAAITAATKAYRLAWCDGPPFAYHWGLENARQHLKALSCPVPTDLPLFDESKYEPMVEVEMNVN